MTRCIRSAAVLAVGTLWGASAHAGGGPTVYVAPDDPTPYRRSDSVDPFRDRPASRLFEERPAGILEDTLQYRLDRLESRVVAQPERDIPARRLRRDLELTEQELRTLEALEPRARSIPRLERQLDRLQNPTELGQ